MILLTGTSTSSVPFEVTVLTPKVFENRQDASNYVRDQFTHILKDKDACTNECLTDGWETGVTLKSNETNGSIIYKVYAKREQGVITYHIKSDTTHTVYRVDTLNSSSNQISILNPKSASEVIGPDTLYWNVTPNRAVMIALSMALVSGYATAKVSTGAEIPKTYKEISDIVPEDDPVTTMIIVYTMLKANNKYALFHIQDGSLFLYADEGFIGLDETVEGFEDGAMCDPNRLYIFSPMYRDIPATIDESVEMFRGKFKVGPIVRVDTATGQVINSDETGENIVEISESERHFRNLLSQAFSPGLQWREGVSRMINLLEIDTSEVDNTTYTLMKIVAKYKLLRGANNIFSQFPCSTPNATSP